MFGYIYKITELSTGKIYVGQRALSVVDENYYGGGLLFLPIIKKYKQAGTVKQNLIREILQWCNSKEELNLAEKFWIKELKANNPDIGYNKHDGGDVTFTSEYNPMNYIDFSGKNNPMYGKKHSLETRQKLSSIDHSGENNPMFGKHHSDNTKSIISRKAIERDYTYDGNPRARSVDRFSLEGEYIGTFSCIKLASEKLSIPKSSISACVRGCLSHAGGYVWHYSKVTK